MAAKTMDHAAYMAAIEGKPSCALRFTVKDALEALDAMPDSPNAGYYADEVHYCLMELQKRANKWVNREDAYHNVLTQVWLILKEAGYCGEDMIDDLRDLVNDSARPAVDEDSGDADDEKKLTTQDLVNAVASSLASWWKHTEVSPGEMWETHVALLWEGYEALDYLYPETERHGS